MGNLYTGFLTYDGHFVIKVSSKCSDMAKVTADGSPRHHALKLRHHPYSNSRSSGSQFEKAFARRNLMAMAVLANGCLL